MPSSHVTFIFIVTSKFSPLHIYNYSDIFFQPNIKFYLSQMRISKVALSPVERRQVLPKNIYYVVMTTNQQL